MEIYRNHQYSPADRAEDLVNRMDIDEKLAQLSGVWAMQLLDENGFSADKAGNLIKNGIGHICRAGVGTALDPPELVDYVNGVQRFLTEETRLGIPAIIHEECLSGFVCKGATIFPQIIGLASTWDRQLITEITTVIRNQMLSVGFRMGLAPVLDIARDPRFGRLEETFGEDPFLTAEMGIAYVRGLQGDDIKNGVLATLKHFAGYSKPEGGLNQAPADIPPRMLREIYLYPFERVIKEAGALSVMNSYNEIDGIPSAASEELLTRILRDSWSFSGIVISDYYAVLMLNTFHHIADSPDQAGWLALKAGTDQELPVPDCLNEIFKEKVLAGIYPIDVVNRAVKRILQLKFILGLFENPYISSTVGKKVFDVPEQRQLARRAARESIILLKNEGGLLPLSKKIKCLAVIGPNADNPRNQLGDYTYASQIGLMTMTAHSLQCELISDGMCNSDTITVPVITVLEGIKSHVSHECEVKHARGCDISGENREGFGEAIEVARSADAVIFVAGGRSGQTVDCTSGEMRDAVSLNLPSIQNALLKEIYDLGKPVILVIINGRPITPAWLAEKIPAIVLAWLPGEEGGNAVADIIFGDYNPCGRLTVTIPRDSGQIPIYYGSKPSGGKSQFWGDYVNCKAGPLYEFGYGLSYTKFKYDNLHIEPQRISVSGETEISLDITNVGDKPGADVVQLYVNDVTASVTRPVKQLKGFERIQLQPGEKHNIKFYLRAVDLGFYNQELQYAVEPGMFKVMIGRSSNDIQLEGSLEID